MKDHSLNRRNFLTASGLLLATPWSLTACSRATQSQARLLSASGKQPSAFSQVSLTDEKLTSTATSNRGHGVAIHPLKKDTAIMFGRRPAFVSYQLDLATNTISQEIPCAKECNMQGHGFFSQDGRLLYTIEMHNQTAAGKIIVRDSSDYSIIKEMSSYGIGPHEAHLMPDGITAVVANGGLLTRPDTGRKIMNLDNMDSNLSYINLASGKLIEQVKVSESKASIRHLDVADDGTVVASMQLQRQAMNHGQSVPLIFAHKMSGNVKLFDQPKVTQLMNDYVGSVTVAAGLDAVCCTTPVGDLATFWQVSDGELLSVNNFSDVCGVAYDAKTQEFILSNSKGSLRFISAVTFREIKNKRLKFPDVRFDNHMAIA